MMKNVLCTVVVLAGVLNAQELMSSRMRVITNGVEEHYSGAGSLFAAITDGGLTYRNEPRGEVRRSDGDHGGCVGWVNDTRNEKLVVTLIVDFDHTNHITKIRYNMGNCSRAETWGADTMTTPFGTVKCQPGNGAQGAWTTQVGATNLSTVSIILEKTRISYETDWLFIGEIEIYDGDMNLLSGVVPVVQVSDSTKESSMQAGNSESDDIYNASENPTKVLDSVLHKKSQTVVKGTVIETEGSEFLLLKLDDGVIRKLPYEEWLVKLHPRNALMKAAYDGNLFMVAQLLKNDKTLVNSRNEDGKTILHMTVPLGNVDLIKLLCANGAKANAQDLSGRTPLHEASKLNNSQIVRILMDYGADKSVQDRDGQTALLPPMMSISELIKKNWLSVSVEGIGIEAVKVVVRRTTPEKFRLIIPVGTYFKSKSASQNMVATEDVLVDLSGNETASMAVPAACVNMHKPIPNETCSFTVSNKHPDDQVARLVPLLKGQANGIKQAAIWMLTDHASESELLRMRVSVSWGNVPVNSYSVVNEEDIKKAKIILQRFGNMSQ